MKQSEIFKKEIFQEKQRADKSESNLNSLRKITDKLLEVSISILRAAVVAIEGEVGQEKERMVWMRRV
jgi:rubrerythrin